jgi:vitamin B12 transporter
MKKSVRFQPNRTIIRAGGEISIESISFDSRPDRLSGFLLEVFMRFLLAVFLLSFAVAKGDGGDGEKVYQLPDTINVTAERFATPINQIVWPARTVSSEEIQLKSNLSAALDGLGGADLSGYGQTGHLSNLFLWGAPSSQVLLLYDGRPVYNYATGGYNLADYNIHELSRIEVVRGTQSSLYGSDAIGGVINLIPRWELGDKISARADFGSFNYLGYNLGLSKALSRWHFNGDLENITTDNARPNSGIRRDCFVLKSYYLPPKGNWELSGSYRYFRDSLGLPGSVPDPNIQPLFGDDEATSLVNHQKDRNHSFDARLKINPDGKNATSGEINLFYEKRWLDYFGMYGYRYEGDLTDVIDSNAVIGRNSGVTGRVRWQKEKFNLSGGLEFLSGSSRNESISTTSFTPRGSTETSVYSTSSGREHHRDTYALWGGGNYSILSGVDLGFSERTELVNGNNLFSAINIDSRLAIGPHLKVKLAYGSAYRQPSFNDLYWPADYYSVGNPDLIPEKGENFLFGVAYGSGKVLSAEVDLFYRRVKDLIAWSPQGLYGRWEPTNLNRFHTAGIDFAVDAIIDKKIKINGNITYQDARQKNKELAISSPDKMVFEVREKKAAFIPDLKWRAGVSGKIRNLSYSLDLVYTSAKLAYYSANTGYDGGYRVEYLTKRISSSYNCSAGLEMSINSDFSISVKISDLFDSKPVRQFGTVTDGDYPSAGREIRTSIKLDID